MRIVEQKTKDASALVSSSILSKNLSKIYSVAIENAQRNTSSIKEIITESYNRIVTENKSLHNSKIKAEALFEVFAKAATGNKLAQEAIKQAFLADLIREAGKDEIKAENNVTLFNTLFDNLYDNIKLETANLTGQFIPYTMYAAPLLRFMIPKLIATDLFTIAPMKGPSMRMYFMKYFQEASETPFPFSAFLRKDGNKLQAGDALGGYGANLGGELKVDLTGTTTTVNLIQELIDANLIPGEFANGQHPIQRGSFQITAIEVGGTVYPVTGSIDPNAGTFYYSNAQNGHVISGIVNFGNGQLTVTRSSDAIDAIYVTARVAYEVRNPARKLRLDFAEYDIKEQRIEETLIVSPEFLHDVKMLFDVDLQAEIVSILSSLIALNTDSYLLMNLYNTAATTNSPYISASSTVPNGNPFPTPKMWYEGEFIPKIFKLEGILRKETPSYDVEPILVMNTIDAQYVRSVDKYTADISEPDSVFLAKRVNGTLDNVIKIVTTPILPEGINMMVLKSNNPLFATAVYAPYVTQMVPYPASTVGPAMTAIHRFGVIVPWPKAIGRFNVTP